MKQCVKRMPLDLIFIFSIYNFLYNFLQTSLNSRYLSKNKSIQGRYDANVERSVRTDN